MVVLVNFGVKVATSLILMVILEVIILVALTRLFETLSLCLNCEIVSVLLLARTLLFELLATLANMVEARRVLLPVGLLWLTVNLFVIIPIRPSLWLVSIGHLSSMTTTASRLAIEVLFKVFLSELITALLIGARFSPTSLAMIVVLIVAIILPFVTHLLTSLFLGPSTLVWRVTIVDWVLLL
jgi:hypothetical protein